MWILNSDRKVLTLVSLPLWYGLLLPVWDAYSVAGLKKFILHVDGECPLVSAEMHFFPPLLWYDMPVMTPHPVSL